MSAVVATAILGDAAEVQRLLKEGASVNELDVVGRTAMVVAMANGFTTVVNCLIREGGADIEALITLGESAYTYTALSLAVIAGKYTSTQWLIEEGALIPTEIWKIFDINQERGTDEELSSLLKIMLLLPMSPEQDYHLPAFVAKLLPQHAELCTRGRHIRARLPAYLEQQRASVRTYCALPAVLQTIVTVNAAPIPDELWNDGLQLL
jgi:hypothetical protein